MGAVPHARRMRPAVAPWIEGERPRPEARCPRWRAWRRFALSSLVMRTPRPKRHKDLTQERVGVRLCPSGGRLRSVIDSSLRRAAAYHEAAHAVALLSHFAKATWLLSVLHLNALAAARRRGRSSVSGAGNPRRARPVLPQAKNPAPA